MAEWQWSHILVDMGVDVGVGVAVYLDVLQKMGD